MVIGLVQASPSFYGYATLSEAQATVFGTADVATSSINITPTDAEKIASTLAIQIPTGNAIIYTYKKETTILGYAMVVDELGKHYPMTVFVGITPEYSVKGVVLMIYREDYGQNVRKRRFLKQFLGKTLNDPLSVNHDITSVSGATISSYSMTTAVKRVLGTLTAIQDKLPTHEISP